MKPKKPGIILAPSEPQVGLKTPLRGQEPDLWPLHASQLSMLGVYFFPQALHPARFAPPQDPSSPALYASVRRPSRRWNSKGRLR